MKRETEEEPPAHRPQTWPSLSLWKVQWAGSSWTAWENQGRLGSQHRAAPGALGCSWAETGKLPGPALQQGDTSLAQQRGLARVP